MIWKKSAIWQVCKWVIILGTIGVAFCVLFGNNTMTYVQREFVSETTTLTWYKIDLNSYIKNLQASIQDVSQLELRLPTRTWQTATGVGNWNATLLNNLALLLDYIILLVNVFLYPFRIGGYLTKFILALLGINTGSDSTLHWLGRFINNLIVWQLSYI